MAMAGLYRRVLPSPPAIEFASSEGKVRLINTGARWTIAGTYTFTEYQLFTEALEGGNMEGFFKLISNYQTQSEPAYCGLASLAVVLNALEIDPGRTWKGPWRWFDDSMLDCCEPLAKIKVEGISFGKVACLAHCNGAKVEGFRTNESTIDNFRTYVMSCTASEDCHLITSYHRAHLKQTGTGHFSPVGGYHAGRDMVLILDVARFKYPPHWIPLTLLWEAMDTIDDATGHHRGWGHFSPVGGYHAGRDMVLILDVARFKYPPHWIPLTLLWEAMDTIDDATGHHRLHDYVKAPKSTSCSLHSGTVLSCRHESWNSIAKYLIHDVPLLLKLEEIKDVQDVLSTVITSFPSNFREFIKWVAEVRRQDEGSAILSEEEKGRLCLKGEVLKQVQETELFEHVTKWLTSGSSYCKDITHFGDKDTLPEIAADVCCQGADLLNGKLGSSDTIFCKEVNVKSLETSGGKPVTVVSGMVITDGSEQRVDMLVPLSQRKPSSCCGIDSSNFSGMHPSTDDVLTVLLLALPPHTWSGIKKEKLREEMSNLVLTANLSPLLQNEVMQLQRQLHFLMTDLGTPSPS